MLLFYIVNINIIKKNAPNLTQIYSWTEMVVIWCMSYPYLTRCLFQLVNLNVIVGNHFIYSQMATLSRRNSYRTSLAAEETRLQYKSIRRRNPVTVQIYQQKKHCYSTNPSAEETLLQYKPISRRNTIIGQAFQQKKHAYRTSLSRNAPKLVVCFSASRFKLHMMGHRHINISRFKLIWMKTCLNGGPVEEELKTLLSALHLSGSPTSLWATFSCGGMLKTKYLFHCWQ